MATQQWSDRGVLITGASKGLGRALAFELATRGARLALVARGADALADAVREIRAQGGEAHPLAFDVGDKHAVYPLAGAAQALLGRVEVIVHAASTLGVSPLAPLADSACEDLERALAVNLVGPFRITKALLGPMALAGEGLVVHVSSDAAVEGYPTWGAYGVSKAGLDQLARVWAAEMAPFGVRFVSVDPGDMDTALYREALPEADSAALQDPRQVAPRLVRLLEQVRAGQLASGARVRLAEAVPAAAAAGAAS
jgi:NAD(P)-dependent dehydrogenase (short-subunit alcohol dehydrogenase family)